jgi:hypothetical protein
LQWSVPRATSTPRHFGGLLEHQHRDNVQPGRMTRLADGFASSPQ